jgi:hypothetical protein
VWEIEDKMEEAYMATPEKIEILSIAGQQLFMEAFENNACMEKLDKAITTIPISTEMGLPRVPLYYTLFVRIGALIKRFVRNIRT